LNESRSDPNITKELSTKSAVIATIKYASNDKRRDIFLKLAGNTFEPFISVNPISESTSKYNYDNAV